MKSLFCCFVVVFFAFSFSSDKPEIIDNENIRTQESVTFAKSICPLGYHAVASYEFSEFRFKRPIYDCESGFWFCTTDGEWVITCKSDYGGPDYVIEAEQRSHVDVLNQTTTVSCIIYPENKTIKFYFPKELANVGGNTIGDFSVLNVDDNLKITNNVILKKGNYSSIVVGTEIIITVDTL